MSRITEKKILKIDPIAFTSDGTVDGKLTIADTRKFMVGQTVTLRSSTQSPIDLKINRIDPVDRVTMILGPLNKHISKCSDISAYLLADGATIEAREQNRPSIPEQEIERHTYEEEPTVARRTILVDEWGCRINEDNPLPTTAEFGDITVGVDLDAKTGDNVAISAHPNQIFTEATDTISTTAAKQIFTYTSTDANTKISGIQSSVDTPAKIVVKLDGNEIRRFYTGPGERNAIFNFTEHRSLSVGSIITVEATVWRINGNQIYDAFTSLEGYIA